MRYGEYTKEKSPFFNTYPLFNSAPTIVCCFSSPSLIISESAGLFFLEDSFLKILEQPVEEKSMGRCHNTLRDLGASAYALERSRKLGRFFLRCWRSLWDLRIEPRPMIGLSMNNDFILWGVGYRPRLSPLGFVLAVEVIYISLRHRHSGRRGPQASVLK